MRTCGRSRPARPASRSPRSVATGCRRAPRGPRSMPIPAGCRRRRTPARPGAWGTGWASRAAMPEPHPVPPGPPRGSPRRPRGRARTPGAGRQAGTRCGPRGTGRPRPRVRGRAAGSTCARRRRTPFGTCPQAPARCVRVRAAPGRSPGATARATTRSRPIPRHGPPARAGARRAVRLRHSPHTTAGRPGDARDAIARPAPAHGTRPDSEEIPGGG